jgi:adenylosuccinate synthase
MKDTSAVIGSQWGDEGKGKIVDHLARQADWVVRFQGGNNAGHTVVVEGDEYVLHLIPSGILHEETTSLIGPGLVVNLRELMDEVEMLEEAGFQVEDRLRVARRAHVLFPYHQYLDAKSEADRGDEKIGTTQKGIGPAYVDKVRRSALRVCDLADPDAVHQHVEDVVNGLDESWHDFEDSSAEALADEYLDYYQRLKPLVVDGPGTIARAREDGDTVLFEGAQGSLLDVDYGTYPYVTSSNPTVGGVVTGAGYPGHELVQVVGLVKAYTTRVGKGPFPTELTGETGEWLREQGGEFGATTGRPRRCGWLDLKMLEYTTRINGFTDIALSKLDVLSGMDSIKVAVDYEIDGDTLTDFPAHTPRLSEVTPVYETLPGWEADITGVREFRNLPAEARDYVEFVESYLDVPATYVSVGPGREQLIRRD